MCTEAHNEHHRKLRAKRAAQRPEDNPLLWHGKVSTYSNHGCRCPACSRAQADSPGATQPGQTQVIPRHELPGRIVLTIGLVMSSLCMVGLIILMLG